MSDAFSQGRDAILFHREYLLKVAQKELHRSQGDLEIEWSWITTYLDAFLQDSDLIAGVPRGKSVVLGSLVWPLFYTTQFIFANLRAGNSVIVKPSEFAEETVKALIDVLAKSAPLFQSVQIETGDQERGRQLALQTDVRTIIFQGSYEAGLRIAQETLPQLWKQTLLFLSAKNPAVILEDSAGAVPDDLIRDCYVDAGQNCMSTSILFVPQSKVDEFQKEFLRKTREVTFSRMIDSAMGDRYLKMIATAEKDGATTLLRGALAPLSPTVVRFPVLTAQELKKSTVLNFEVLAPLISIVPYSSREHLRDLLGALSYGHSVSFWGNAASFLSGSRLEFGRVVVNQSAFDPRMAWGSFNSKKRSGNHAELGKGLVRQLKTASFQAEHHK